jgi:hypothetical protein
LSREIRLVKIDLALNNLIVGAGSNPLPTLADSLEVFMNQEEATKILARLKKYTEKVTSSKEKAMKALVDAGLVKSNGQPTDLYKN